MKLLLLLVSMRTSKKEIISSYKVVKYIQKLHHFCNRSSPDDGPKSSRKYLGNKQLWKTHQSIPAECYKINTAI